ncbi:methyltransferase family protein [Microbacterium resistens]|uniref:methyltransferase family protein n=1 Tax=Microbacterium resistens TaxID=156977 RepID=UPI0036735582
MAERGGSGSLVDLLDRRWGRAYFAFQALAGIAWWIGVFTVPLVRDSTLGRLDPVLVAVFDIPLFVGASVLVAAGVRAAVWVAVPWTALVSIGMATYATVTGLGGWGALAMAVAALASVGAGILVLLDRVPVEWIVVGPFRFRSAPPAPTGTHLARTGIQTLVFSGVLLLAVPLVILFFEQRWGLHPPMPPAVRLAGAALFVPALVLSLWSGVAVSLRGGGTPLPSVMPNRLVVTGPYRFVRNPMAVGGIAQGVAVGLMLGSWLVVAYALAGSVVWNTLVRPQEEADLERRFGREFLDYREDVSCWIPRLRPRAAERTRGHHGSATSPPDAHLDPRERG